VPETDDDLDENTLKTLAHFEIELRSFKPKIWPKYGYPIGNKVDVATQDFETDTAVFLDTDILVLRPFETQELTQGSLSAAPIMGSHSFQSRVGLKYNKVVEDILGQSEFALSEQLRLAAQKMPPKVNAVIPMFNSGVVAFKPQSGFAELWKKRTIEFLDHPMATDRQKSPFADQASLAIAAYEFKDQFHCLDHKWNSGPRRPSERTIFRHYFRLSNLLKVEKERSLLIDTHLEAAEHGLNLLGEITVKDLQGFRAAASEDS